MDNQASLETIASQTLDWKDDTKFIFIWDRQAVVVYYNREFNRYRVLSGHSDEDLVSIYGWLNKNISKFIEFNIEFEDEKPDAEEDSKSRD